MFKLQIKFIFKQGAITSNFDCMIDLCAKRTLTMRRSVNVGCGLIQKWTTQQIEYFVDFTHIFRGLTLFILE